VGTVLATGNQAAGQVLAMAGEANRLARGCGGGAYPITPQTEIAEYLTGHRFAKGSFVTAESEHSAMAVCIGVSVMGARSFTASSSNGLLYMTENVFAAGYCRLPLVMVVCNRTVGPPWNIWVDQGDSLAMRDSAWLQFYCESHQDLVDTILLAFRVAEDQRVLLPAMVAQDGFLVSHTLMRVDIPEQTEVDRYLPTLRLPQRLRPEHPVLYGSITPPRETENHRRDLESAMAQVPIVLGEAIDEFEEVFGRRPHGAFSAEQTADADAVLVASNTMARTARRVVEKRRAQGEKIGLVGAKLFRPFLRSELVGAIGSAKRVAVLDRNLSPGSGGIFWNEAASSLCQRADVVLQGYLMGLGGGDVTEGLVEAVLDDLLGLTESGEPVFFPARVA
jgi:pyruvate/2-oxoacid:ferredoxin oxidoreductase alpha subunit